MEYAIEGHFMVAKSFTDNADLEVEGGITIRQYKEMYAERVGRAVSLNLWRGNTGRHAFSCHFISYLIKFKLCTSVKYVD